MDEMELIRSLPPEQFFALMKLALWMVQSCEEHGLELAYQDDEIIMFRFKKGK